jgi:hypothetical protein
MMAIVDDSTIAANRVADDRGTSQLGLIARNTGCADDRPVSS